VELYDHDGVENHYTSIIVISFISFPIWNSFQILKLIKV